MLHCVRKCSLQAVALGTLEFLHTVSHTMASWYPNKKQKVETDKEEKVAKEIRSQNVSFVSLSGETYGPTLVTNPCLGQELIDLARKHRSDGLVKLFDGNTQIKATKIEPETVLWPGTLLIMLKSDVVGRFLGDF